MTDKTNPGNELTEKITEVEYQLSFLKQMKGCGSVPLRAVHHHSALKPETFFYSRNTEGIIFSASPSAEKILGQSPTTPDNSFSDIMSSWLKSNTSLQSGEKNEAAAGSSKYELEIPHGDGGSRWLNIMEFPVQDDSGRVVSIEGMARDITLDKEMEAQLFHSQKLKAVGCFTGGIAHDFNNILAVIIGYCEMALEQSSDTQQRSDLMKIHAAGKRGETLTKQLLSFCGCQTGKTELVNLSATARNVGEMLKRIIGEDIELVIEEKSPDAVILADPCRMEQIIMNLALNARDAMPEGGRLIISTDIVDPDQIPAEEANFLPPDPCILLSVSDTGTGIPYDLQDKVFTPFFTTKEKGAGTGLGLASVYSLVKGYNGQIRLSSRPEFGTTFDIYLPRAQKKSEEKHCSKSETDMPGGSETILFVEDDHFVRELITDILQPLGYHLLVASSADEGAEMFRNSKSRVALLLTDVIMPGKNGLDLADELQLEIPDLKTLFMSGYNQDTIQSMTQRKFDGNIMCKPVSPSLLTRNVRKILDS